MPASSSPARPAVTLAALGAAAVGLLVHTRSYDFVSDDGFIALRYARNLAQGQGLVFNPGERVEGFTSLAWVGLLAGAYRVGLDLLASARILGMLAALLTLVVAWRLAAVLGAEEGDREGPLALLVPALLAGSGALACWAPAGLETALFTLVVTAAVWATASKRWAWSAALVALATLARPEGLAVAVACGAWGALRGRRTRLDRRRVGWLAVVGGVVAAATAFRLLYFGDFVPNTFHAKTGGGLTQWARGLRYLSDYGADHEGLPLLAAAVLLALLLPRPVHRLVGLVTASLLAGIVLVGGDGLPMYRFLVPVLPLAFALEVSLLRLAGHWAAARGTPPGLRGAGGAVLVALLLTVHLTPPRVSFHYPVYLYQRDVEVPRWARVGRFLRQHAAPGESLATVPIGAVGYYSGLVVRDMVGLTDQHIARQAREGMGQGWAGHEKHDGAYILSRRPTYLLLGNIDVTAAPRDPAGQPFIPPPSPAVWARERDIYEAEAFTRLYRPRSAALSPGEYLNFYELRPEFR